MSTYKTQVPGNYLEESVQHCLYQFQVSTLHYYSQSLLLAD